MAHVNAFTAHREWAVRPKDQTFHSIQEVRTSIEERHTRSTEHVVNAQSLRVVPDETGTDLRLTRGEGRAHLTHWSAGQLAILAGAPANYIRRLPAHLAADNLNYGLQNRTGDMNIYVYQNGRTVLRSANSEIYGRIHDLDVVNMTDALATPHGFLPPLTNPRGVFGMPSVEKGSKPGGLYASDRDVFMMLINDNARIEVDGEMLGRAIVVRNSEVGAGKYVFAASLYRFVCGNSIQHGFQSFFEFSITHKGDADTRFRKIVDSELVKYLASGTGDEVSKIRAAMHKNVAKDDEEAGTWLRNKGFQKGTSEAAVKAANVEEGGAGTLWQLVNGLTAVARKLPHADQRYALEKKAGKLLSLVN